MSQQLAPTSLPQASSKEWAPPPDPDFEKLASEGLVALRRDKPAVVAFDTETSGFEWHDAAFCVTAAWRSSKGGLVSAYFELDLYDASLAAQEALRAPVLVGHNIKFDLHRALSSGLLSASELDTKRIHDTEAMAHLDDEHRKKGLKELAVTVLGVEDIIEVPIKSKPGEFKKMPREKWELENAKKWAKKEYGLSSVTDVGYNLLPRGTVVPYAIKDAEFTLDLARALWPRIKRFDDLTSLYHQEMAATRVFLDLEGAGLGVNESYVTEQIRVYHRKIMDVEEKIAGISGKPVRTGKMTEKEKPQFFNPQSNDQIAKFFKAAGFKRENYDAEQMEGIDHPMAKAILELRGHQKILGTYFMALKKSTRNGVFHPSIRQHGTVTGRTSSGGAKGD